MATPLVRRSRLTVDSAGVPAQGRPLKEPEFGRGFAYSDCWVEDSRLVLLNARDAADRGAAVRQADGDDTSFLMAATTFRF